MSLLSRVSNLSRMSSVATRRLSTIIATQSESKSTKSSDPISAPNTTIRPHHVVVSISGRDRTGIVQAVSSIVADHEANLEESRMALLGGDFAMILYVSMKQTDDGDLLASKLRTELPSFSVSVRETVVPSQEQLQQLQSNVWTLSLEGPDHPGIVSAVSQALAVHGSNVKEMDTETTTAPFAGYELFKLDSKLTVDESKLDDLSKALDAIEDKFGSTISLVKE